MPKAGSNSWVRNQIKIKSSPEARENRFYFLEGVGTLLWVFGDVTWIFELDFLFSLFYILAVLGNFAALSYAFLKLRGIVPLVPVLAYNLWVIMGCLWALSEVLGFGGRGSPGDYYEFSVILFTGQIIGAVLLLITVYEFALNRNNRENLHNFIKIFRRFRIREASSAALSITDILTLPDNVLRLLKWLIRQENAGLAEISSFLKQDITASRKILASLVERGFLQEVQSGDRKIYQIHSGTPKRIVSSPAAGDPLGESLEMPESDK